jgi:hypothetical protein
MKAPIAQAGGEATASCSSPVATASRHWPRRTATSTWPKRILPHPPTPSVLFAAPKAREVRVVKSLNFPFEIHARVPPEYSVCRVELPHGVS